MGNIKKQLIENAMEPKVLALKASTEIPREVEIILDDYSDFGIKNKTIKYLRNKKKEIELTNYKEKVEVGNCQAINTIVSELFPFKVVTYDVIHQVAQDHNLIISSLSLYNETIEKQNIDELRLFQEHLKRIKDTINKGQVSFPRGNRFTFDDFRDVLSNLDFTNYFNIVAPISHFDFSDENTMRIGREIKPYEKKPGFKLDLKLNVPEPKDPIIIAPFYFMKRLYCAIVTSWDEVADDLRIRNLI